MLMTGHSIRQRFQRLDERYRRLSLAVVTSASAKAVRFVCQLLIVSMAIQFMGATGYGLWMTVFAGLGWLSWGQAGLAPGLATLLARADGGRRPDLAGLYFTTALYTMSGLALLLFGCALLLFNSGILPLLPAVLDQGSAKGQPDLNALLTVSLGLTLIRFPMGLIESAYTAIQQVHLLRMFEIFGQLMSLIAAAFLIQRGATATVFILGITLAAEVSVALAAIYLVCRLKPELMPLPTRFNLSASRELFNLSFGYLLIQIGGYFVTQSGILLLAVFHGTAAVAQFTLTWQLYQMVSGIWMMFVTSLWGALAQSRARSDWRWIDTARRRLTLASLVFSGVFSTGLAFIGTSLIGVWSAGRVHPDPGFMVAMAIYCTLFSWIVLNAQILDAIGAVWQQSMPALFNGVAAVALALLLVPQHGATGLALALILAAAASTAWMLPGILNRLITSHVAPA